MHAPDRGRPSGRGAREPASRPLTDDPLLRQPHDQREHPGRPSHQPLDLRHQVGRGSLVATGHLRSGPGAKLPVTDRPDTGGEHVHSQLRRRSTAYGEVPTLHVGRRPVRGDAPDPGLRTPSSVIRPTTHVRRPVAGAGSAHPPCAAARSLSDSRAARNTCVRYPGRVVEPHDRTGRPPKGTTSTSASANTQRAGAPPPPPPAEITCSGRHSVNPLAGDERGRQAGIREAGRKQNEPLRRGRGNRFAGPDSQRT